MEELCSTFSWPFLENKLKTIIREELNGRTDDYLMTRQECMKFLQCSSTSLYYHVKQGKLKYYKLGRTLLFKRSDVFEYITVKKRGGSNAI